MSLRGQFVSWLVGLLTIASIGIALLLHEGTPSMPHEDTKETSAAVSVAMHDSGPSIDDAEILASFVDRHVTLVGTAQSGKPYPILKLRNGWISVGVGSLYWPSDASGERVVASGLLRLEEIKPRKGPPEYYPLVPGKYHCLRDVTWRLEKEGLWHVEPPPGRVKSSTAPIPIEP